ncbi:MAG: DNA polymerase III subunit gamma/tau [Planctomycetota bacterium]
MSYTVLARKYRPTTFDETVGQGAIARTLASAIENNRVAHAYLFVGTRGVGKTTTARVFAKALNGGSEEVDAAIMSGQDTDVIEIDAASNTGVDQARELIANAAYRPLRGKHKIYIIDEVHMLSTAAFNALLKTLEEPPEHVKFILCTTETHKVPATIQSRCQRFDFRNLGTKEIADHLASVLSSEDIKAESDLLHEVARLGNGSMRDALSLMDRVIAAAEPGSLLTLPLLEDLLGLPDRALITTLIRAIVSADTAAALEHFDALAARGTALDQTLEQLVVRFRDLMIISACGPETELVPLTEEARVEATDLAGHFDAAGLCHMIALCESVQRLSKQSSTPRALADALIVRLAMTEHIADVAALVASGGPPSKKA